MQGPVMVDLVLPATWNHARALVPSQSRHRRPSVRRWPQLGAGSGKGQNPTRVAVTIAQAVCGSEADLQSKQTGWRWLADHAARFGVVPRSLHFLMAAR